MKVGILTFSHSRNYGAMLQAYALQKYLTGVGVDAKHILVDETHKKSNHTIKGVLRRVLKYRSYSAYNSFANRLSFYPGEYNEENAGQLNEAFDMFISGSDQVWNVTNGMNPMFYQKFVSNRKKASYAASFGISKIPEQWIAPVKRELESFDYISVRERTAQIMLEEILERPVQRVVDPVFLLDQFQWNEICGERIEKKPYVFVYGTQMTSELKSIANRLAKEKGIKICSVFPMKGAKTLDSKIGPIEFVNYVKNAEYVITTSFHCTAFSLIYEKPLIEVLHTTTGSRAADLLELVGMRESCVWSDTVNIDQMHWNYTNAREILRTAIEESQTFIKNIIVPKS